MNSNLTLYAKNKNSFHQIEDCMHVHVQTHENGNKQKKKLESSFQVYTATNTTAFEHGHAIYQWQFCETFNFEMIIWVMKMLTPW